MRNFIFIKWLISNYFKIKSETMYLNHISNRLSYNPLEYIEYMKFLENIPYNYNVSY
jgi:hypothetical protein